LKPEHRTTEPDQFLQETYGKYVKLVEASIVLKKRVEDKLVDIKPNSTIPPSPSLDLFVDTSDTSDDNNI
jgi:hypothetical protein